MKNQIQFARSENAQYQPSSAALAGSFPAFKEFCAACYRKVVGQINKTKETPFNDFRERLGGQENLLRLALNEADALAWQTGYPNLVFPELASEKAQAAAAWEQRQETIKKFNHR